MFTDSPDGMELRRRAMQCAAQASDPRCGKQEREQLLAMRASLLALADNADWLAGRGLQSPPLREAV